MSVVVLPITNTYIHKLKQTLRVNPDQFGVNLELSSNINGSLLKLSQSGLLYTHCKV